MRTLYVAAIIAATVITLSACSETKSEHPFNPEHVRPIEGAGSAFVLPNRTSVQIVQHGSGLNQGDYSEAIPFSLSQTSGKWQIWIAHNIWSAWSVKNKPGDFVSRSNAIAQVLSAIHETRTINNLDFELNFLQLDKVSPFAKAGIKKDSLVGMRPPGGTWCDFFWNYCTDRYVLAPFARNPEPGVLSQRQWLDPYVRPVVEDIERNGTKSKYIAREHQGIRSDGEYWDQIHLMAFIVNPDGKVVDALIPLANGQGVSSRGVITRYLSAAGIDFEKIKIPEDNKRSGFKKNYLYAGAPMTKFGGDFTEVALETIRKTFLE